MITSVFFYDEVHLLVSGLSHQNRMRRCAQWVSFLQWVTPLKTLSDSSLLSYPKFEGRHIPKEQNKNSNNLNSQKCSNNVWVFRNSTFTLLIHDKLIQRGTNRIFCQLWHQQKLIMQFYKSSTNDIHRRYFIRCTAQLNFHVEALSFQVNSNLGEARCSKCNRFCKQKDFSICSIQCNSVF